MHILRRTLMYSGGLMLALALLTGCNNPHHSDNDQYYSGPIDSLPMHLWSAQFNDPIRPVAGPMEINLSAAKNEAVSFGLQLRDIPAAAFTGGALTLRLEASQTPGADVPIDPDSLRVYQVLNMPVDLNKAAFVRHTGLPTSARSIPRALLPLPCDHGVAQLSGLRNPNRPLEAHSPVADSDPNLFLWVDLTIPAHARAGNFQASCVLMQGTTQLGNVVLHLHVDDFSIPDDRHLLMVGALNWDALVRLYGPQFEMVTPYLLARNDPKYAPAIRCLDALIKLGQEHRLQVVVGDLQPQVKWPTGQEPEVDWEDFDSVVAPYLSGQAFADHVPLGYWPLPPAQQVQRYDLDSQKQYWNAAAAHFGELDWLRRAPMQVEKFNPEREGIAENYRLCERAAQLIAANPHLRLLLPLEDDELAFKTDAQPALLDEHSLNRLITAAPGLVYHAHLGNWPANLQHPEHWLRTDVPGLIPYAGAGSDEQDVRLWAFLAYLRSAHIIQWGLTLPRTSTPDQPADPGDVVWFYPGQWFGLDEPVPTVQLKWLRRAEQDYEYLRLAWERGEAIKALVMARLLTKPVQINSQVEPDPAYSLMSGTTDPQAWATAKDLLAQTILLHRTGQAPSPGADIDLNGSLLHWSEPQEKPLMFGRTVQWGWSVQEAKKGGGPLQGASWVDVRVGLDVYNAADQPLSGQLQWQLAPPAWEYRPQPVLISPAAAVNVYNVARYSMDGAVNLNDVTSATRRPVEVTFTNAQSPLQPHHLQFMLPVACCTHREGQVLAINGDLGEWDAADAIQDGPLVKMFDRRMMQKQQLEMSDTPSHVYATWSPREFFLAFKVAGVAGDPRSSTTSYPAYQSRRAWGEDLCEVVIQPVYDDNSLGPVTHLVIKPHGQLFVENKLDRRQNVQPWQTIVGADVRYAAAALDQDIWRGELAIPWDVINDAPHHGVRPTLLRFNFAQHKTATGESATWAGPVDFARDEAFMGLLNLR